MHWVNHFLKKINVDLDRFASLFLALTDLLFNCTLISRCISDLTHSNGEQLCRLLSYLSHLAEFLSACFTAHFTAQRFIAVRFPLSVFMEKKIHLIHYFIIGFFLLFGILYCLALVSFNRYDVCHEELDLKWFLSDALLSFLVPFTIITILNILIISHLKKNLHHNSHFRFGQRHLHPTESFSQKYRKKTSSLSSSEIPLRGKFSITGSVDQSRVNFQFRIFL